MHSVVDAGNLDGTGDSVIMPVQVNDCRSSCPTTNQVVLGLFPCAAYDELPI